MGAFLKSLFIPEAIAAENRTVCLRFERNLTGFAALGAYRVIHLARAALIALASHTAGLAALRLVCKVLFGVKLLLAGSKSEFLPAFLAD